MKTCHDTPSEPVDWQPGSIHQPLTTETIDLWWLCLDQCPIEPELFSEQEHQRQQRISTPSQRHRFIASRCALRRLLSLASDQPPETLIFDVSAQGKPHLVDHPQIHFNLSHSGDKALIAISRMGPVGVDLEPIRERPRLSAIARRVLPASDQQDLQQQPNPIAQTYCFTQAWVRFEARQKMTGAGLFGPRQWPAHQLHQFIPAEGWLGACAIASSKPLDMRCWQYPRNNHTEGTHAQ